MLTFKIYRYEVCCFFSVQHTGSWQSQQCTGVHEMTCADNDVRVNQMRLHNKSDSPDEDL